MFYNLAYNSESGKNKNIHFWVAEESEKVLIENRVPSSRGVKEYRFKVTIHQ